MHILIINMNNFIQQMKPTFGKEEADACYNYMNSSSYITEYKQTRLLEKIICDYINCKYCFMVNNGTISLSLALIAIDVKPGDEIIVPNLTMIATPNSVKFIGAKPILVDVDENTLNIDIDQVEKYITDKTKAIMHVSLNARCNDIIKLKNICEKHKLYLIEDAAQSIGSFYKNKHIGTFGDIGSFSFSTPKLISCGQGGCIVTNNDVLADKIRMVKDFGRMKSGTENFITFGINSKITDLQAVIGIEQMKKLPTRVKRKKEMWNLYYNNLKDIVKMIKPNDDGFIPWFIDIYTNKRDELFDYLKSKNIGTRKVYKPINDEIIYKNMYNGYYPISKKYSYTGLWLPSHIELVNDEIEYICNCIKEFFNQ